MSIVDAEVQTRRDKEWAAAKTREELEEIERRWWREDEAAARAEHGMAADVARLARRVERVERLAAPEGILSKAVAKVIRQLRQEVVEPIAARVAELEAKPAMTYRGTFDQEQAYPAGSVVTHAGAGWVAVAPIEAGEKPGRGAGWRLAIKSAQAKEPGA